MRCFSALAFMTLSLITIWLLLSQHLQSQRRQQAMQGIGIIHAPDFPTGIQWFNTDKPLSLKALRGKFVLLDFWTYC
jgi:hypothetical protein